MGKDAPPMRVWLVEEPTSSPSDVLALRVRSLLADAGLALAGSSAPGPHLRAVLRAAEPDAVVVTAASWAEEGEAFAAEPPLPVLFFGPAGDESRVLALAERLPAGFASEGCGPRELRALLWTLGQASRREAVIRAELLELRQRLEDRIIIERAKGLLMTRLGISEPDAFQRLRVQSRQQRKPIREIAQAILDLEFLLGVEDRGNSGGGTKAAAERQAEESSPAGFGPVRELL
jgi:response regulator NasT